MPKDDFAPDDFVADDFQPDTAEWQGPHNPAATIAPTRGQEAMSAVSELGSHIYGKGKEFVQGIPEFLYQLDANPVGTLYNAGKNIVTAPGRMAGNVGTVVNPDSTTEQRAEATANFIGDIPNALALEGGVTGAAKLAKAKALKSGIPESLIQTGQNLRQPVKGGLVQPMDLATTGVGYMTHGVGGAAAMEGLNLLGRYQPVRNMMARGAESMAEQLSPGIRTKPNPTFVPQQVAEGTRNVFPNMEQQWPPTQQFPRPQPPQMPPPPEPPHTPLQVAEGQRGVFPGQVEQPPVQQFPRPQPGEIPQSTPPLVDPVHQMLAQAIEPRSHGPAVFVSRNAGEILRAAPELRNLQRGPQFDSQLVKAYRRVNDNVEAADGMVDPSTTVPRKWVMDRFNKLIENYTKEGRQAEASAVTKEAMRWEELPDNIPWSRFRNTKRSFFDENPSNSATMRAYAVLMDASNEFSGVDILKQANRDFSTVRRVLDASKLDPKTGQRSYEVGKSPSKLQKAIQLKAKP